MKHTIDGFIVWDSWRAKYYENVQSPFRFLPYEPDRASDSVLVGPATIEVEVPDDFNPTPGLIANLQAKKQTIEAKFTADLAQVDHEIGKLLSLEHKQ